MGKKMLLIIGLIVCILIFCISLSMEGNNSAPLIGMPALGGIIYFASRIDKIKKQVLNQDLKNKNTVETISNYHNTQTKKIKKAEVEQGIGLIIFIIIILSIVIGVNSTLEKEEQEQAEQRQTIEQYVPSYDDLDNIVRSCGFDDYNLEYSGEENGIYYFIIRPENSNTPGGLNIQNQQVISVDYANHILYENGQVVHTLSDYIITSDEKNDLVFDTQTYINNVLKSPSTAKYPWYDEWYVGKDGDSGIITVQGYVDAQNSFGATTRSQFQVKYQNNQVISLIFDGEEYIK